MLSRRLRTVNWRLARVRVGDDLSPRRERRARPLLEYLFSGLYHVTCMPLWSAISATCECAQD